MSETAHIPQLRFPEFSGGWEENKLGDIATFSKGKGISKSDIDDDGQLECIRYGELYTTYNEIIKDIHSRANIAKDDTNLSKSGDVIIPASGETAIDIATASCVLKDGVAIGGDLNIIRSDVDGVFNAYYLNNKHKHSIARLSQGSSVIHLYPKHLEILKLNLPTKPEQQKIAAFLTAVDNKIEQLSKKQELLGEYKKGAMQQIFSQAIRFKADDGSNFPDWEEVKLGNLTHKVGKKNKENIKYPIYSINNQEGFRPQSEQFDGLDSNDRGYDISLYKIVNEKTFAYNPARINVGSIGYSYNLNKVIVSSLYVCFKTNDELEDLYLLAYLDTDKFNKDILRYEEGGVRQYLFYENFSQISIPLPGNDEQAKISNFLSSIDNKIEQVDKQLDESKQFKKALLQQMFV